MAQAVADFAKMFDIENSVAIQVSKKPATEGLILVVLGAVFTFYALSVAFYPSLADFTPSLVEDVMNNAMITILVGIMGAVMLTRGAMIVASFGKAGFLDVLKRENS